MMITTCEYPITKYRMCNHHKLHASFHRIPSKFWSWSGSASPSFIFRKKHICYSMHHVWANHTQ